MNKTLWKLDRVGERLWLLARISATQAAALGKNGRGIAVVAEETGKLTDKINKLVEAAAFDGADMDGNQLAELAFMLNLLALNSAIEASRLGNLGKQAAVCAGEIRDLANEILHLFDKAAADNAKQVIHPWPKNPLTSVGAAEFLHLEIGGVNILERLDNVQEVCAYVERKDGTIMLRGMELPIIDSYKVMGKVQETPVYAVIKTPWADQNKVYAVAAAVKGIHLCPPGKNIDAPDGMPLAKYVRECWENENGELFYFMDWVKVG